MGKAAKGNGELRRREGRRGGGKEKWGTITPTATIQQKELFLDEVRLVSHDRKR